MPRPLYRGDLPHEHRGFNQIEDMRSIKMKREGTDRPIHRVDRRKDMEELDFRQRAMVMAGSICRTLERVRMNDRRPLLDMDVHE